MDVQDAECDKSKDGIVLDSPIILSSSEDSSNLPNIEKHLSVEKSGLVNSCSNKLRELLCAQRSESRETDCEGPVDTNNTVLPLSSYTTKAGGQLSEVVAHHESDRLLRKARVKTSGTLTTRPPPVKGSNGKVTFACNTKLSLLKLAHKLRLARERVAKKKYSGPRDTRIRDLLYKKAKKQHENSINSKDHISKENKPHEAHCNEVTIYPAAQIARSLPAHVAKPTSSNLSNTLDVQVTVPMKQSPALVNSKLMPIPPVPKQAIDFLTTLKVIRHDNGAAVEEIEEYVKDLPDCNQLPLWPLLGANKESASKMEIPALNEIINKAPIHQNGSNNKVKGNRCGNLKPGMKHKLSEDGNEPNLPSVPHALTDAQLDAVEKAAVATVLSTNLPKNARKAYDICRLSLDACKRIVNQNIIRAAAAARSHNANPGGMSIITQQHNTSSIQVLNNDNKPSSGTVSQNNSPYTVSLLKMSSSNVINLKGAVQVSLPKATKNPNSLLLTQQKVPLTVTSQGSSKNKVVLLLKDVDSACNSVELVTVNSPSQDKVKKRINVEGYTLIETEGVNDAKVKSFRKEANNNPPDWILSGSENSKIQNIPRKFQCSQCSYQTDNRSHLRRHESSVHSGDKLYCCYVCKKEFARSEKCRSHIIKTHPEVGYDHRFIRKDRFQSRQVYQSPSKNLNEEIDSTSKASPVPFTSTPIKGNSEISEHMKQEVTYQITDNLGDEVGEESNGSHGMNLWDQNKDQSNVSNESSHEDSGLDLSLKSTNMALLESPTRNFRCQICFYVGRDSWHLKRHIADVHNNKKAFRCRVCDYVSSRKHRLISHMKGHGELYCIHCEFSTTDYEDFSLHLKYCAQRQRAGHLACKLCKHPCFNRKILSDHMHRVHKADLYCCELCHFTCTDEEEFESHEQEHFKVDCSATCNKCKVTFDNEKMCATHVVKFHKREYDDAVFDESCVVESNNVFQCLLCLYDTVHKSVMKNHVDMHARNKYVCETLGCQFSCTLKKIMRNHTKCEHTENIEEQNRKSPSPAKIMKEDDVKDEGMPVDLTMNTNSKDGIIYDERTGGLIGHGSGRWNCTICADKSPFRYRRSYEKHMLRHTEFINERQKNLSEQGSASEKGTESMTVCRLCKTRLLTDELPKHMKTAHKNEDLARIDHENQIEGSSNWSAVDDQQNGFDEEATDQSCQVVEKADLPAEETPGAWSRRNSVQDWVNQQQPFLEDDPMEGDSEASGMDELNS